MRERDYTDQWSDEPDFDVSVDPAGAEQRTPDALVGLERHRLDEPIGLGDHPAPAQEIDHDRKPIPAPETKPVSISNL